ncbi:hypothetical protein R5R35_013010 [Gryllus longicercus]|uniref:Uncharacterized protein n=1 Tax=Gryllus longicercus TaxID=2509291 RepID=A0AAN9V832_9ORTH
MEDGDDDISLTADEQNWDNQGSSENDAALTKDEKGLSPGEQYIVSSTSPREDNPYVSPATFDEKEDLSDQDSENKTFSSDTNPIDNSSELLDENCDELHNNERSESSPCAPSEQPTSSEENDRIVSQDYFSEPHEDQGSGGEGNTFSCVEETENVNSSLGEEEEEEEEEEEDHQTSASSDEIASKLPESYLQSERFKPSEYSNENDEDFKSSDFQNDEYDGEHVKSPTCPAEKYDGRQLKSHIHPGEYVRHVKSPDHPDVYDDGHVKSPNHPDDYDDPHVKSPNHSDDYVTHVKSPNHSDEYDVTNVKSPNHSDEYGDMHVKSPNHSDEYDDTNVKSPNNSEEYDDRSVKSPDEDEYNEHLKSPDHHGEYDRLLKSPDRDEYDGHLKSPDHQNESDRYVKSPDHQGESDRPLKSPEHQNEYGNEHLKSPEHEECLKSYDQPDEEYHVGHLKSHDHSDEDCENVQKSDTPSEFNDEKVCKSDSPNEYNDQNIQKSDCLEEYEDENFRISGDPNNDCMKTSEQVNEFSDKSFKKYDHSSKDDLNVKSPDLNTEYTDKNSKKFDSSNNLSDENFETLHHPNEDIDNIVKASEHPNKDNDDRRTYDHPSEEFSDDTLKKFDNLNDGDEVEKLSDYPSEDLGDEALRISDNSYEGTESENFQKQDQPEDGNEEECNTEQDRSCSGPLSDTDLQHENYDEDKETEELSQNENYRDNCNAKDVSPFPEESAHNDNSCDEDIDSNERDLVMEVDDDATLQNIDAHVEISPGKGERDWEEADENPIPKEVGDPEDLGSESECTDEQLHLKIVHSPIANELQNIREENDISEHNSAMEVKQQSLKNNADLVVSDGDAVKLVESEVAREQWVETRRQEEKVTSCNSDNEEEPPCNSPLNSIEKSSETEEPKFERVDKGETISKINEQVFETHEIKSPERYDANKIICKKACVQECHSMNDDDHDDAVSDDNLCANEANNAEKVNEPDNVVKVNGEIEIMDSNLLNDKESSVSSKDKIGLKRKHQTSPTQEISSDISPSESVKGNIQFKGFKKRYIAQVSEVSAKESPDVSPSVQEELRIKNKRPSKKLVLETPQVLVSHQPLPDGAQGNTPLTEYAQYLGLQPTVKFKCYNCGESGFPSMLKLQEHQNVCLKNIRIHTYTKPPPSPIVEPAPSTNFRITRKVYLCSACGTYYENWNLFLHMREVHKRHICLFCLLMFSQADKLAQHLTAKHEIADNSYNTPEHFLNEFKGSFFVMCCTCEQMFSERDNFFDHLCKDTSVGNTDQACSLCGLKGAHFPTCRRAFTDSSSLASPSQNNSQTAAVNTSTDTSQNSQLNMQDKTSASKFSVQTDKLTTGRKSLHKLSEQNHDRSDKSHNTGDLDDDYDISDAASYCHVNIHEPDKQKVVGPDENIANKDGTNDETNIDSEKMDGEDDNDEQQPTEENRNAAYIMEETAKDNSADNNDKDDDKIESVDLVSQDENQMEVDRLSPHFTEDDEENRQMEVDEKSEPPPPLISSNANDAKVEPSSVSEFKSPKGGESESDSSASGADSHDSDGSSSSSEASSDENEPEDKEPQKTVKSDESDIDKSDSDKMSIVVDDARSEDEGEKQDVANDDHSAATENETNEIHESKNDISNESDVKLTEKPTNTTDLGEEPQDNIQIAGDDVPLLELTLEESLDALSIQSVVKECVKISCSTCVYCNHAKKIAVNGKQLVLHLLAEHRFEPVVCSDSGELTPVFGFVDNLKSKLSELQDMFFNTDSYDSADKSFTRPYDRTYECFHCHFITTLHKELYVHNRKMHQKTILLCIMCKSNFYSYSELLCHLCPGIYVPDSNILFRCCLCVVDGLPSAFRLMVHLRKRHHACDVCLETTGDQQKLSNHVWKHKLHHLCYRCGIAYRNKPDITKHLFWKHGTESVLCKKCLQKKWPHVYHFCIPPTAFLCEECNASFTRAVALKVHKRLHADDVPYQCDECEERFISKKLLRRHKEKHKQVIFEKEDYKNNEKLNETETHEMEPNEIKSHSAAAENDVDKDIKEEDSECVAEKSTATADTSGGSEAPEEISKEADEINSIKFHEETKSDKKSKVVDVYDLPPLNLSSESDDSDEEPSPTSKQPVKDTEPEDNVKMVSNENAGETLKSQDGEPSTEEEVQPVQIVDGVWDNFKTYKANLEKREILQAQASGSLVGSSSTSLADNSLENHAIVDVVMADHDYCVLPEKPNEDKNTLLNANSAQPLLNIVGEGAETAENLDDKGGGFGADHNYCFNTSPQSEDKKELTAPLPPIPSAPPLQSPPLPVSHPSLPTPPPPTPPASLTSSPKKKQKSPKKKQKQSGSSSSSDSSSNSDSSSCTCGTNCSCSSSSSSSSGSSSSSSDSDSSSSEGRRRQAARRERRRERTKRKLETGSRGGTPPPAMGLSTSATEAGCGLNASLETTHTPVQMDSSGAGSLQVDDNPVMAAPEPEENELLIRESDLDTTETETDEDFYDKYPQRQANKLLAEKRNQLLLLAAVAPVNNGTITQPSPPPPPEVQEPVQKKKGKTKRHKKAQHNSEKKIESKLKLNIPVSYYNSPSFSVGNPGRPVSPVANSQTPTSSHVSRLHHDTFSPANPEASSTPTAYHSTGSGSETESKRLSKRKRIPKKFYGDSSDEEAEHTPHQPYKWRKVIPASSSTPQIQPPLSSGFGYRAVSVNVPPPEPVHIQPLSVPEKSDDEDGDESDSGHEAKRSSSDSSNSDSDNEQSDADSDVETVTTVTNAVSSVSGNVTQQKNENLYCYCQCPYDEVSEMIACDGKDCSIEWFHFECVGIMVPPKGKWFCPDCRKKTAARGEYLLHV